MVMTPGVSRNFSEADYIAKLIKRGTLLHVPTNAGWTTALVGTGAITSYPFWQDLVTGTTASSSGMARTNAYALAGADHNKINWDKKLYLIFNYYRYDTDAEIVARVQLKQVTTIGALGAKGIGLRVDNFDLVGESYGSQLGTVALSVTLSNTLTKQIVIIHSPAVPKIEWFVDGVLKGTQSTAANMPTGVAGAASQLMHSIANGATGGVNGESAFYFPTIFQER